MTDYTQKAERDEVRKEWEDDQSHLDFPMVMGILDACDTLEQRIAALEKALRVALNHGGHAPQHGDCEWPDIREALEGKP